MFGPTTPSTQHEGCQGFSAQTSGGSQAAQPFAAAKLEAGSALAGSASYRCVDTGLDESTVGIKIAGRNINNLRYADDTTLMAESEEELKSLLMRVKEESAKVGLKLNIKKTKIMASGIQEAMTTTVPPPQEWNAVLRAQLLAMEKSGTWWQFTASVLTVFRQRRVPIRRGEQPLWVPEQDLACRCLHLQVGKSYLVIGNDEESPDPARLILDKNSLALPWRDAWAHKLRSFQQQSKRGKCHGV
ncbi:Netrin-5 [Varanus komodoensis]|nr:Netrin-5 [Varanus komodoensis]